MHSSLRSLMVIAALLVATPLLADDWPQWMGPQRDSVWREQGIVDSIPSTGLPVKWRAKVGLGYGGPAVVGDRVYVMDYIKSEGEIRNSPGGTTSLKGQERVVCFSADTGEELWNYAYDCPYDISYASGPRCTPTVQSGKVYALGAEGHLTCLNAKDGTQVWQHHLPTEYKTKTAIWGYASHPLVDGDLVYSIVGGEGSVAVAFNKDTGREVWRALSASGPGYCPPTMIEQAGVKQLIIFHPDAVNSLNPKTGEVYWSVPINSGFGMSINAPRKLGNKMFACSIGNNSVMIELNEDKPAAQILWRGQPKQGVYCANSTPFLEGEVIYGCDIETGALTCARISNGERLWETTEPLVQTRRPRHATAFLVKHEDRFFLFNELGDIILAKLTPEGYQERGRFHILEPTNEAFGRPVVWTHPAFAQKSVFARNDKELVRVSLAAE